MLGLFVPERARFSGLSLAVVDRGEQVRWHRGEVLRRSAVCLAKQDQRKRVTSLWPFLPTCEHPWFALKTKTAGRSEATGCN